MLIVHKVQFKCVRKWWVSHLQQSVNILKYYWWMDENKLFNARLKFNQGKMWSYSLRSDCLRSFFVFAGCLVRLPGGTLEEDLESDSGELLGNSFTQHTKWARMKGRSNGDNRCGICCNIVEGKYTKAYIKYPIFDVGNSRSQKWFFIYPIGYLRTHF